ncbi:hypothetical protein HOY82DRAFT_167873 [Tuber indicum]|nr:hypothetical protein HOY82DRAFT_167873 [Tuber indicum]
MLAYSLHEPSHPILHSPTSPPHSKALVPVLPTAKAQATKPNPDRGRGSRRSRCRYRYDTVLVFSTFSNPRARVQISKYEHRGSPSYDTMSSARVMICLRDAIPSNTAPERFPSMNPFAAFFDRFVLSLLFYFFFPFTFLFFLHFSGGYGEGGGLWCGTGIPWTAETLKKKKKKFVSRGFRGGGVSAVAGISMDLFAV